MSKRYRNPKGLLKRCEASGSLGHHQVQYARFAKAKRLERQREMARAITKLPGFFDLPKR